MNDHGVVGCLHQATLWEQIVIRPIRSALTIVSVASLAVAGAIALASNATATPVGPTANAFVVSATLGGASIVSPTPTSTAPPGGTFAVANLAVGPFASNSTASATTASNSTLGTSSATALVSTLGVTLSAVANMSLTGVDTSMNCDPSGCSGNGFIDGGSINLLGISTPLPSDAGANTPGAIPGVGTYTLNEQNTVDGVTTITAVDVVITGGTELRIGQVSGSGGTPVPSDTALKITSSPVTGAANSAANLGPITVEADDSNGSPVDVAADTTVDLGSSSSGATFATSAGGSPVTSVTIPAGSSSTTFYYGDQNAGTPTVTASSDGLTSATQQETINNNVIDVSVSGSQTYGGDPTFTGNATDAPSGISLTGSATCTVVSTGAPPVPTDVNPALNTGSYQVIGDSCSGLTVSGPDAADYGINYESNGFTVDRAPLTVHIATTSRYVGQTDPDFASGITVTGEVLGQTAGQAYRGTSTCTARHDWTGVNGVPAVPSSPTSPAGPYRVLCTGLHVSANYMIIRPAGVMNVLADPNPSVSSLNPASGNAGTVLTLAVGGYIASDTVVFSHGAHTSSPVDADIVSYDNGTLMVTVPAVAAGKWNVYLVTADGKASAAQKFTVS